MEDVERLRVLANQVRELEDQAKAKKSELEALVSDLNSRNGQAKGLERQDGASLANRLRDLLSKSDDGLSLMQIYARMGILGSERRKDRQKVYSSLYIMAHRQKLIEHIGQVWKIKKTS
jgi:sugar-specific transcriptional regulator TrmB